MRIEFLMPGMPNVVRFPIERRCEPSIDLLREIAPDMREADLVADAFGIERDLSQVRHQADRAMAEHILNHVDPVPGPRRRLELNKLLRPLVVRAVDACRQAHRASEISLKANEVLARAEVEGGYWLAPLKDRAEATSNRAAHLLVKAYLASQEAEGACRAIGMAMRGEPWEPFDIKKEEQLLFFGEDCRREPVLSGGHR